MQQVKCNSCETTRFFNHILNGVPILTCIECGAQFTLPTQPEQEPRPEPPKQSKPQPTEQPKSFEETPETVQMQSKQEFEQATGEKVKDQKPAAVKIPSGLTPEQREEHIRKLKGGE